MATEGAEWPDREHVAHRAGNGRREDERSRIRRIGNQAPR